MNRIDARLTTAAVAAVAATGIAYAWMLWCCAPADEFAVVHHPWQPTVQDAHLLVAPVLVFAVGLVFRSHALAQLGTGAARRRTGWLLLILFAPMVVSGYLLQVLAGDIRAVAGVVHAAVGGAFLLGFIAHRLRRRQPADPCRNGTPASRCEEHEQHEEPVLTGPRS
ncbi:MAG TPA: hypothetical protein VK348_06155 [Planctomycetota bacterium]|nr:hypothetical protein [Planctomycetota bacterium]